VDRPWTAAPSSPELRPLATPGLKVAEEGAGEVEEAAVSTFVCSSELRRWGNGGAVEIDDRRWSVGVRSSAGEGERGASEVRNRCGVEVAFIGAGDGR
jgi:hypothetical protein